MDDFYAARGGTIPPLPWSVFAPALILGLGAEKWWRRAELNINIETDSSLCRDFCPVDAEFSEGCARFRLPVGPASGYPAVNEGQMASIWEMPVQEK